MVWHSRDMTCHGDGWEEIAGSILHINTLERISIITYPELIETAKESPVCTTTTTSTTLYNNILIFCTNAIDYIRKSAMISDVEMTRKSGIT